MAKNVIPKGTTLTLTYGEYSDQGFDGPFTVSKDIDKVAVAEEFRAQFVAKDDWDTPGVHAFMSWLSKAGYISDIAATQEWHVGSYGFDPEFER